MINGNIINIAFFSKMNISIRCILSPTLEYSVSIGRFPDFARFFFENKEGKGHTSSSEYTVIRWFRVLSHSKLSQITVTIKQ